MQQQSKIKFDVKLPLILIHTPFGLKFFDDIARTRAAKFYAKFNTYLMPLITAMALFLILGAIITLFTSEIVREGARGIGPQSNLLIPGLNPYLPIAEGWIALVLTIIVHEAGHGIVARVHGVKVESTGIVLFLGLPIGAFVNIERDELDKISIKQKSSIMTAGPMSNIILAGVSLLLMLLITSSLTTTQPVNPNIFGVSVISITPNSQAESLGLTKGSTIQQIQDNEIRSISDLQENLASNLGKTVSITWLNEDGEKVVKQTTLPKERRADGGILGFSPAPISDPKKVLDNYNSLFASNPLALLAPPTMAQGLVPFSVLMQEKYSSPVFGSFFSIPANLFFWLWFINFNVAIFNALPIGPLDGGQLYNAIIDNKTKKRKDILRHASKILTIGMIVIVALAFVVPWLLR